MVNGSDVEEARIKCGSAIEKWIVPNHKQRILIKNRNHHVAMCKIPKVIKEDDLRPANFGEGLKRRHKQSSYAKLVHGGLVHGESA